MAAILSAASAVGAGETIGAAQIEKISIQGFVIGAGAVSATVVVEGSNNAIDWVPIATLNLSGTDRGADGGVAQIIWEYLRARVTAISGTNAAVTVLTKTRGPAYGS